MTKPFSFSSLLSSTKEYHILAALRLTSVKKKLIRGRVAYPGSDIIRENTVLRFDEAFEPKENHLTTNLRSKIRRKVAFHLKRIIYLDFLKLFLKKGSKLSFTASFQHLSFFFMLSKQAISYVETPWNRTGFGILARTFVVWLTKQSFTDRTQDFRRIKISVNPGRKSSNPAHTYRERRATASFAEALHVTVLDNFDCVSESFRSFYEGETVMSYKGTSILIPRILALKAKDPVVFKKLNRSSFSKRKYTTKFLLQTLFRYHGLFFFAKKIVFFSVFFSVLRTKNLRAFRLDFKFLGVSEKSFRNYKKGSEKALSFETSPFLKIGFYSGRKKAKQRRIGILRKYFKQRDILFHMPIRSITIWYPARFSLLFFRLRRTLRHKNVLLHQLTFFYRNSSYFLVKTIARVYHASGIWAIHAMLESCFKGNMFKRLYFSRKPKKEVFSFVLIYPFLVSFESSILSFKKLLRFNSRFTNSFKFYAFKQKYFKIPVYGHTGVRKTFFF